MGYEITKDKAVYAVETLKQSGTVTVQNIVPLLLAWLVSLAGPVVLLAIMAPIGALIDHAMGFRTAGLGTLIGLVVPGLMIGGFYAGWIYVSLKAARGIKIHKEDVIRPLDQMLSAFAVLVITTVICGLLSFTVVIPAFLFLKWQLAPYYIVDKGLGPIQALKQSWNDTNAFFIQLAILDLIFFGIQALLGFTIIIPFLAHIALSVATAIVYDQWLGNAGQTKLTKVQ